ncbi:hypothetical protein Q7O_004543 [Pectobacterium carotovorum subsp. carotovorum PCCS1]|nr:hypothetical protein [Pectobacterium carotovorum subsp. carotovorum PCCS1]
MCCPVKSLFGQSGEICWRNTQAAKNKIAERIVRSLPAIFKINLTQGIFK